MEAVGSSGVAERRNKATKKEKKKGAHSFGDVVTAKIVAVESQRLKLRTPAKMIGHVHKSELSDDGKSKKADLTSYHVGQVVSVRVIGQKDVKPSKAKGRRVLTKKVASKAPLYIFSMRTSILTASNVNELQKMMNSSAVRVEIKVEEGSGEQTLPINKARKDKTRKDKNEPLSQNVVTFSSLLPRLALPDSFSWNEEEEKEAEGDDSVVEIEETGEDSGRRKSRKDIRRQERQIYDVSALTSKLLFGSERDSKIMRFRKLLTFFFQNERSAVKEESGLETEDDFEKLVLTQPNKSMPWIQYMAFLLQAGKAEEARKIAQKALNTISFRQERKQNLSLIIKISFQLENLFLIIV